MMRLVWLAASLTLAVSLAGGGVLAQRQDGQGGGAAAQGQGPQGRGGGRGGVAGGLRGRGAEIQPAGTSVIRGRVFASDTGTPVRRAQVRAQSNSGRGARLVTTDGEGRFELRDLPAGRWVVSVSKGGFVTQQFGQRHPYEAPEPIELADGQRVAADFALSRGGVITGHVFDEFGDPVTGARVQVMRSQMRQGRRQLSAAGVADQTDDTGAFRIFGLAPGDYYVAGNLRVAPIDSPEGAVTYAPTYYPGTPALSEAQRVQVLAGQEQSNLGFVLMPVRAVRVTGTIVGTSGEPIQAIVNLIAAGGAEEGPQTANAGRTDAGGNFTITNVVPGSYLLNVNGRRGGGGARGGAAGPDIEMASVPIAVGDGDVAGVTVVTSRGATVRGTVVFQGGARPQLGASRVTAQPLRPGFSPVQPATITSTGTFELSGLLGPHAIRLDRLPPDWTIRSITAGGVDVTDRPVDFRGTEQVNVSIVLTDRITEITGTVSAGNKPADASVVVFADDPEKWTFPSRYVQTVRSTAEGAFSIRALPPGGRYLIAALDYLEQGEQQDPEFLERIRGRASSVSLADGDKKSIALTVTRR